MMRKRLILKSLGEKSLSEAVVSDVLSHCPSMELVVLGTLDQQVQIYRLNGQQIYASNQRRGNLKVDCVCWKPDGMLGPKFDPLIWD
jgi:anaphase-promoting complex subunit 4